MPTQRGSSRRAQTRRPPTFYTVTLSAEPANSIFIIEYNIILKTVEAVNSFNALYRAKRQSARGGPSTHAQQDLYRAMLIFACAGLDAFVKQLINSKLPQLLEVDERAKAKFQEFVKGGLARGDRQLLNTVALALIDIRPREIFLKDYIESMTGESLQSVSQLCKASDISGLNTRQIFTSEKQNALRDAFTVRNEIIHAMDLNLNPETAGTSRYRTRRMRTAASMEAYTRTIIDLSQELFRAYKTKFAELKVGEEKKS